MPERCFENYNFFYEWEKEILKERNEQGDQLEGYLLLQVREREREREREMSWNQVLTEEDTDKYVSEIDVKHERKRGVQNDLKDYGLRNLKGGFFIYQVEKNFRGRVVNG